MESNEQNILDESIYNLEQSNFNNGIIQDNKLVFIYADKTYRVRTPIQSEQAIVDNKRNLMQLEYLQQEGCITRKQLIKKLKDVSLYDVEKAEEDREKLIKELKQIWFILATKSSDNPAIKELTEKVTNIENQLKAIAIETATQLAPSLESRLEKFTVEYLTFLCTDIKEEESWKRVWNSFDDFQNTENSLIERAGAQITWLLLNKKV